MDIRTRQYASLQTAMRWCQWMAVLVVLLGLAGGASLYYLADQRFRWVGFAIGGVYVIPAIGLLALADFIGSNKRWAITAALIIYVALEIVFVLNVVGTLMQAQVCGAALSCMVAVGILIAIIKIAGAYAASREGDGYVPRGFDPIVPSLDNVWVPIEPTSLRSAASLAETSESNPRGLGWIVGVSIILFVVGFDFILVWANRSSFRPTTVPPAPTAVRAPRMSPPLAIRAAPKTPVSRKGLPSRLKPVEPDADLDAEASKAQALKRLRDGIFTKPRKSSDPTTYLDVVSSPGDWIGNGQSYSYAEHSVQVQDIPADGNYVGGIVVKINDREWSLNFGPPRGEFLDVGEYPEARRWPFNGTAPGLDFGGHGHGCNQLTGAYIIWELELQGQQVTSLAVDFIQHCERHGHPLCGRVRYHSSFE